MRRIWIVAWAAAALWMGGCGSYNDKSATETVLQDNPELYDDPLRVTMGETAVTIPVPNEELCRPYDQPDAPERPCTLEDVEHDIDPYDDYEPTLRVALTIDDNGTRQAWGIMKQKGKSTRLAPQKSFRIKMDTAVYNGQRTLQLNKHFFDDSRLRNKLFFDLFVGLPHFASLRTKFFEMVIDGESYGLFTHIEKVDEYYLQMRGLPTDGRLYKAQNFTFRYRDAFALDGEGRPIDEEAFDRYLEIENGKKHTTVVNMIRAVENVEGDAAFMEVFNRYFDRENYLTWMAVNLLSGNRDTTTQNFFLYNPKGSDRFYFIPWDYDDTSKPLDELPTWQWGYGLYWDIPLHRKFLKIAENRQALLDKVRALHADRFNAQTVEKRLTYYRGVVENLVTRPPDSDYLSEEAWSNEVKALPERIENNYAGVFDRVGAPMPFWQVAEVGNGQLSILWDRSIDLEGDAMMYDIVVADNPEMEDPILSRYRVPEASIEMEGDMLRWDTGVTLPNGRYYLKITAREVDNPDRSEIAFDTYADEDADRYYYGVLMFEVP